MRLRSSPLWQATLVALTHRGEPRSRIGQTFFARWVALHAGNHAPNNVERQSASSALCTPFSISQTTRRNRLQRATRSFFALGHVLGVSTCWNASTPRPDGFSAPITQYVDPNLCITVYHYCRDIFPRQKTRDVIDIAGLIWLRG